MKLGIIGGTGNEGYGLSLRWAISGHEIIIGSRDAQKGAKTAAEIKKEIKKDSITGMDNKNAAKSSDIIVL